MEIGRYSLLLCSWKLAFVFLILQQTCKAKHNHHHQCPPSACGKIHNISYPFRLNDDPKHCGDKRYTLSCDANNRTVLNLYSGKFYVEAINYNNYTIRLVDPNVDKDNCSSIPLYSLNSYNFNEWHDPYSTFTNRNGFRLRLSEVVVFLKCENPVNSLHYIDTAPCNLGTGTYNPSTSAPSQDKRHNSYVMVYDDFRLPHYYDEKYYFERLGFDDLVSSCRIEQVALKSWRGMNITNTTTSYSDIHNQLLYGFELSWFRYYYKRGRRSVYCHQNDTTNKVECLRECVYNGEIRTRCNLKDTILDYIDANRDKGLVIIMPPLLGPRLIFGLPCVIVFLIYKWRRRHLSMYDSIEEFLQSHNNLIPIRYSYSDIKKMTSGYKHKLGEGGFGSVYKGKLRSGHFVAVKVLGKSKANGQEFINEVATIGRIHNYNVVQLIGFCFEGSKRALVYEFMPNGSLDKYIFSGEDNESLSCKRMFEISLGVARGIQYLHRGCEMQILHFDIKPHNILLDQNFVPKVSDFGLARLCPLEESIVSLTAARGTIGYIAPELFYKNIGGVSYKADVYSFGMLLMEMASRRKNLNAVAERLSQIYFPSWVYDQFNEGNNIEILKDATEEESKIIKKMVIVALYCIQLTPSGRPSMDKIVEMLEGEVECLEMPPKPFLYPPDKSTEDVQETASDGDSSEISLIPNAN